MTRPSSPGAASNGPPCGSARPAPVADLDRFHAGWTGLALCLARHLAGIAQERDSTPGEAALDPNRPDCRQADLRLASSGLAIHALAVSSQSDRRLALPGSL